MISLGSWEGVSLRFSRARRGLGPRMRRRRNGVVARKQSRRNAANIGVIVIFSTVGLFKTAAIAVYVQ